MALTNLQLWDYLRQTNPNFASHTSKGTKELFTERGYEALKASDADALSDFFKLSMRVAFQKIDFSNAKNPMADSGVVQTYDTPNGGYTQRMAVSSILPVTPAFRNLEDGSSVDPWIVRKPEVAERLFAQNFDFQTFVSIQDYQIKTAFITSYGMSDLVAGIMQGMMNAYTIQEYTNTLEALNAGIHSTNYPLQDSQVINVDTWTSQDNPSVESLEDLILKLKDVSTSLEVTAQTSELNAMGFATTYTADDMVCLMRAGIKNRIQTQLMVGAYNPENLSIPFSVKEVENFGGLIPQDSNNGDLQEVYDVYGAVKGYIDASVTVNGPAFKRGNQWLVNVTSGSTTADTTFLDKPDHWSDPNEDVLAVIVQKGILFRNIQNPLETRAINNPRGLYTNYWVSSPGNSIVFDPLYACIVIKKAASN